VACPDEPIRPHRSCGEWSIGSITAVESAGYSSARHRRSPVIAIVESRADRASEHICRQLRERADWTELTDDDLPGGRRRRHLLPDRRGRTPLVRRVTHRPRAPRRRLRLRPGPARLRLPAFGDTGALLTGHFTGNFGPAEFGGESDALAEAAPNALNRLLEAFHEYAPERYDVGMECTHHGPSEVGCPSLFAELGSGDEQWDDPAGADAVARAILELRTVNPIGPDRSSASAATTTRRDSDGSSARRRGRSATSRPTGRSRRWIIRRPTARSSSGPSRPATPTSRCWTGSGRSSRRRSRTSTAAS